MYLKIDVHIFRDPDIGDTAQQRGPKAWAYWLAILAEAKQRGDGGRLKTSVNTLARIIGDPDPDEGILIEFAARGLIDILEGQVNDGAAFALQVAQWEKWQSPTNAERQAKHRKAATSRGSNKRNGSVTGRNKPTRGDTKHNVYGDGQGDRDGTTTHIESSSILSLSETPSAPAKPTPRTTIQKPSNEEVQADIDLCRKRLGSLAPIVDDLAALMAAENKTGRARLSRVANELWRPILEMASAVPDGAAASAWLDALRYGLEAARSAGAPNARYAQRAATSYLTRPTPSVVPRSGQPRTSATTAEQYDNVVQEATRRA